MSEQLIEVSANGLERLQSAITTFAKPEVDKIATAVIATLRSHPPVGLFDEVAARHMWDEFCWALQGPAPFGEDSHFDDLLYEEAKEAVARLPRHISILLSAFAIDEFPDEPPDAELGLIWADGIERAVMGVVRHRAAERKLDMISPNRGDNVGYEVEGGGAVWSALDGYDVKYEVLSSHVDELIDAEADLAPAALELVEGFFEHAKQDDDCQMFAAVMCDLEVMMKRFLVEKDVLPMLQDMRAGLLAELDED